MLNLRLRALRRLEEIEIRRENQALTREAKGLRGLIAAPAKQRERLRDELAERGHAVRPQDTHWYPSVEDFTVVYAAAGFIDIEARLIPRPTPLPSGVAGWVRTFRTGLMDADGIPEAEQVAIGKAVEHRTEAALRQPDGSWLADYVRLRFSMRKPA